MNKMLKSFKSSPYSSLKWSNYFEVYENVLSKFVGKKITLVEVGIGNGGSLFMWKKFLGKKAKIIGIELNPEAKKFEKYGFKIFAGDQSDPLFWRKFYKKNGKVDILIDDGGHTNLQQITTLMESIENINKDGAILIEDTHTSFRNHIKTALNEFSSEDYIIYSDNDEIPNLEKTNLKTTKKKFIIFNQKIFYYKLNLSLPNLDWFGSKACKLKHLTSIDFLRNIKNRKYSYLRIDTLFSEHKKKVFC